LSLLPFDFYDVVWYHEETASFPEPRLKVGRWLGEAQDFGQAMCYWVLSESVKPIVQSTVQNIPPDKLKLPELQEQVATLDRIIADKLGSPVTDDSIYKYDMNDDQNVNAPEHMTPEYVPLKPDSSMPEADDWDAEAFHRYIAAKVRLPKDGQEVIAKVIARKRDHNGNPIGKSNSNPFLDTRLYQVVFPDVETAKYSANVIAECLYSQVNDEGNQFLLMNEIIDWLQTDEVVKDEDIFQMF
jgi:hypothetical protein